jgi:hypothetical protein
LKMPDNWPHCDVIAQPKGDTPPQRISVKSRTFKKGPNTYVVYDSRDQFEWLAIVLLPGDDQPNRRIFIVPRGTAGAKARHDKPTAKTAHERYWPQEKVAELFPEFENNFGLSPTGFTQPLKASIGDSSQSDGISRTI